MAGGCQAGRLVKLDRHELGGSQSLCVEVLAHTQGGKLSHGQSAVAILPTSLSLVQVWCPAWFETSFCLVRLFLSHRSCCRAQAWQIEPCQLCYGRAAGATLCLPAQVWQGVSLVCRQVPSAPNCGQSPPMAVAHLQVLCRGKTASYGLPAGLSTCGVGTSAGAGLCQHDRLPGGWGVHL